MASRINVDTVIDLVSIDIRSAIRRLTTDGPGPTVPAESTWRGASVVTDNRRGYPQHLDAEGLAEWAAAHGTVVRLLVRPGHYVFPGAPIALLTKPVDGADAAIRDATALGDVRLSSADIEFAMRQLVEVAVRALSSGINDPHTAISALDRLATALCDLAPVHLATGVYLQQGRVALVVPSVDYGGVTDSIFHMIRQYAAGSPAVLVRMLEVLTSVVSCEHDPARQGSLQHHADLVLGDCERHIHTAADAQDVRDRHAAFVQMRSHGPGALAVQSGG